MSTSPKGLSLQLIFRIFAGLQFFQGVMMLIGSQFSESSASIMAEMNQWQDSIGITTMAEHHGAGLICLGLLFWVLPGWLKGDSLKEAVPMALIVQGILLIMPIYHAAIDAFPIDPSFYVMIAVFALLMVLTFTTSRKLGT